MSAMRHAERRGSQSAGCHCNLKVTADECVTRYVDATALKQEGSPCCRCSVGRERRSRLARQAFTVVSSGEPKSGDSLAEHIREVIANLDRPALAAHVLREAMRRAGVNKVPSSGGCVLRTAREMGMEHKIKRVRGVR